MTNSKLVLFAENVEITKKGFSSYDGLTRRLVAMVYAQQGQRVECEAIRDCRNLIKQNTSMFSSFRGNIGFYIAALLSLSSNPQQLFDKTLKAYALLKDAKFKATEFLVVGAYQIAVQVEEDEYEAVVTRAKEFYDDMKDKHFFNTGVDDYIFAIMLGLAKIDVAVTAKQMELYYSNFKKQFGNNQGVQALAQILTLGDADDNIEKRVSTLYDALRANKIKLNKEYMLPMLGVFALLPMDIDTIVSSIIKVQTELREQKGFSIFAISSQELILFVSALVVSEYIDKEITDILTATLSTNIINIIQAQNTAMLSTLAAVNAAQVAGKAS